MRHTRRLKRMARNRVRVTKMNLTSLMDVFTILVFFLLVNSGSVEVMEAPKNVQLPESLVEVKPRETVTIFVTPEDVLVQGKAVAQVAAILDGDATAYEPVTTRLAELTRSVVGADGPVARGSQEVTILADKAVPFIVVRKLMSLCTDEGYEDVSLAVVQKESRVAAN